MEALLLLGALAITAIGWLVSAAALGVPAAALPVTSFVEFAGAMTAAHLVVRFRAPHADPLLLPCVALANGLGLVLIDRLDHADRAGSPDMPHQVIWTMLGVGLFAATLIGVRDHQMLARYGYTCGLVGIVLLLIPAVLPSRFSEVNGGKSWILLHGFSIQPGEFAKVLLLIFVAAFLVANRALFTSAGVRVLGLTVPRLRDLGPLLLVTLVSVIVLVYEKNLGFSLLVFGTVLAMIYIATERVSWLLAGIVMFSAGCYLAYHLFPHVRVRVEVWRDPFATYYTTGYQIAQAQFGLATGGMAGTGLGSGQPQDVPFAKTDFVLATIGEELGLIGLTAVVLVLAALTVRGFRAALGVRDSFGKVLGGGLAFALGWQLFVVMGGVTKLIPLTGLTTPFISYGGSSLLANYVVVALLIRISNQAGDDRPPARRPVTGPLAALPTELVPRPRR